MVLVLAMKRSGAILLLVNLPAEVGIVVKSWREITWRRAGLLLVGILVGVPMGTYVLQTGSPAPMLLLSPIPFPTPPQDSENYEHAPSPSRLPPVRKNHTN